MPDVDIVGHRITDINGAVRPTDDKGRIRVDQLTTDEKLSELLTIGRALSDGVEKMSQNPALKMMGF
jgi:hypothetical protein